MGQMKIIAFITEGPIVKKILKHLGLWDEERSLQLRTETARDPPPKPDTPEIVWIPVEDVENNVFPFHKWKHLTKGKHLDGQYLISPNCQFKYIIFLSLSFYDGIPVFSCS